MASWESASFENEAAGAWFLVVEEAVDPGSVIAETLDAALAEAEQLELDLACQAIAAAELSAACAGHPGEQLPDHIRIWTQSHPHLPHDSEIEHAIHAVTRIREDSELRQSWQASGAEAGRAWRREIDDLIARLRRSGAGEPATLAP
ncbi:MAG: DUF4259 domain-containing protein [Solirubrobacteraceae bacterium]